MDAYFSRPQAPGNYPAVIVGMELFGITAYIRKVTDRIAADGYLAIAPNFYHRSVPGAELGYDQASRSRGFELLHQLSRNDALQDIDATMRWLRDLPECTGKIGFIGLSIGGHIAYLGASQYDLAACAIFYAGWLDNTDIELSQPEPTLALTAGIAKHGGKILYLVGEEDALISRTQFDKIDRALTEARVEHEMILYPGAQHGFFCEDREAYDPSASADAWQRTRQLFSSTLHTQN
jgi:carboxymethylenebutenolidase